MSPELPFEILDRSDIIPAIHLPEMECSMIRFGVRCNNFTTSAWLLPAPYGAYVPVSICAMCLEEMQPCSERTALVN